LSNFQYGQQALLQTFLVGQPEFRAILQSPTMQQLRQRVTATCHIGPLDLDETRGYIEHRLKCAGSSGRPTFSADAFLEVFKASGGIPRRINLICDRLLLLGFLSNKDAFGPDDVIEVVNEIHGESTVPDNMSGKYDADWVDSHSPAGAPTRSGVGDPGKLQITPILADSISSQVESLEVEQYDSRLRRLERSVLRLERINLESLVMLKKLVAAARTPSQESKQ
jgi:general secretion pathway protein A